MVKASKKLSSLACKRTWELEASEAGGSVMELPAFLQQEELARLLVRETARKRDRGAGGTAGNKRGTPAGSG